jgi:adenylylsulfate kinase-like enzyme
MIYVLYGQPASGKTSLGIALANCLDTDFVIDGDEFRWMFKNNNYGREGREENIKKANTVATYLNKKGCHVIMSLVNPYEKFRDELVKDNERQVVEIYLYSARKLRKEYHVEDFEVGNPHCIINTDEEIEITWERLKKRLRI